MESNKVLEIGDKLIAINACVMEGTGIGCLTIGKEYPVESILPSKISVIDDIGHEHWFMVDAHDDSGWNLFFELKARNGSR